MATTRVTLQTVHGRCIAALNAAPAGTWALSIDITDDNRRNDTEIDKAILAADAQVCLAICETIGHGYRSLFLVSTPLIHGEAIPEHLGPIEMVRIELFAGGPVAAGREKDADDIDAYRNDTLGLYDTIPHDQDGSTLGGYFKVIADEARFTGSEATALLAIFERSVECQSPESYEDIVFNIAMMNLVKEGDSAPFGMVFTNGAQQGLALIRGGAMVISPAQLAQAA